MATTGIAHGDPAIPACKQISTTVGSSGRNTYLLEGVQENSKDDLVSVSPLEQGTGKVLAALWHQRPSERRQIIEVGRDGTPIVWRGEPTQAPTTSAGTPPLFVGAPSLRYSRGDEAISYARFALDLRNRKHMVYRVTGNGWLRALDAATGFEAFTLDPGSSHPEANSSELASAEGISTADVFIANRWRTVLVGTSGDSIYALDVTDPAIFTSTQERLNDIFLWRLNDSSIPKGWKYSQPVIAKLQDGSWAAIVAGSYFNQSAGGQASGNVPAAFLDVVDIATGTIVTRFMIPATGARTSRNALSPPTAVNARGDEALEYIYAGDLLGNVWKFDLTAGDRSKWHFSFNGEPLFRARDSNGRAQPIVARPEAVRGPGNSVIVLVGAATPESGNNGVPSVQSFYGLVDRQTQPIMSRANLRRQSIIVADDKLGTPAIRAAQVVPDQPGDAGWYLDFPADRDERLVTHPIVRNSRLIFVTQSHRGEATCQSVLTWVFALDPHRGGEFSNRNAPVFRIGDQLIGTTPSASAAVAASTQSPLAADLAFPAIAAGETHPRTCALFVYPSNPGPHAPPPVAISCGQSTGRESWRQLR